MPKDNAGAGKEIADLGRGSDAMAGAQFPDKRIRARNNELGRRLMTKG